MKKATSFFKFVYLFSFCFASSVFGMEDKTGLISFTYDPLSLNMLPEGYKNKYEVTLDNQRPLFVCFHRLWYIIPNSLRIHGQTVQLPEGSLPLAVTTRQTALNHQYGIFYLNEGDRRFYKATYNYLSKTIVGDLVPVESDGLLRERLRVFAYFIYNLAEDLSIRQKADNILPVKKYVYSFKESPIPNVYLEIFDLIFRYSDRITQRALLCVNKNAQIYDVEIRYKKLHRYIYSNIIISIYNKNLIRRMPTVVFNPHLLNFTPDQINELLGSRYKLENNRNRGCQYLVSKYKPGKDNEPTSPDILNIFFPSDKKNSSGLLTIK